MMGIPTEEGQVWGLHCLHHQNTGFTKPWRMSKHKHSSFNTCQVELVVHWNKTRILYIMQYIYIYYMRYIHFTHTHIFRLMQPRTHSWPSLFNNKKPSGSNPGLSHQVRRFTPWCERMERIIYIQRTYGRFLKWGVPPNCPFQWDCPLWTIHSGYPHLWKPLYSNSSNYKNNRITLKNRDGKKRKHTIKRSTVFFSQHISMKKRSHWLYPTYYLDLPTSWWWNSMWNSSVSRSQHSWKDRTTVGWNIRGFFNLKKTTQIVH